VSNCCAVVGISIVLTAQNMDNIFGCLNEAHGTDIQNVAPSSTTYFTHITPRITCFIGAESSRWLVASFHGSYFSIYIYDFAVVIPFTYLLKVLSSISYFFACSWLPFLLLYILES
jgi:hypothetical protein